MSERLPLAYLVPLRLLFGVILVLEGWGKLQGGWLHGSALLGTLNTSLAKLKADGTVKAIFAQYGIADALTK